MNLRYVLLTVTSNSRIVPLKDYVVWAQCCRLYTSRCCEGFNVSLMLSNVPDVVNEAVGRIAAGYGFSTAGLCSLAVVLNDDHKPILRVHCI